MRVVFVAAFAVGCFGASINDQQFNGRWDIAVSSDPARAWWLEVSGAGTPSIKGKFVGVPVGQLDDIPKLSISDGELRFALEGHYRRDRIAEKGLYWARLEDGRLKGTFEIEGNPATYLEWTGVRAPALPDKDDFSWKRGEPIVLFDGHDLNGWQPLNPGKTLGWIVKDGSLTNPGGTDLISDKKFWNFSLDVEYRVAAHCNSGIALRGRYEVQILDDADKPPSTHSSGSILSRLAPASVASKLPGEWQTMTIRLVGRQVTVIHNGVRVLDKQTIDGPTAIATDSNEAEPGPILLQGDHGVIEFRHLVIYPLFKKH